MLKLENIDYKLNSKFILNNINLEFNYGINLIIGKNGSGKSTLLNIITTLYKPSRGVILFNDEPINKDYLKIIGYSTQNISFIQDLTVEENLYYFSLLKGCDFRDLKTKIPEIIEIYGLHEYKDYKVSNISGGIKQKISIVLALINDPEILILDEPMNNLDVIERSKIYSLLKDISKNKIILISTHLIEEIEPYYDYIYSIENGNILSEIKYVKTH